MSTPHRHHFREVWTCACGLTSAAYQAQLRGERPLPTPAWSAIMRASAMVPFCRCGRPLWHHCDAAQVGDCQEYLPAPTPKTPRTLREHELKCWPEFFARILSGEKRFEIRQDDRGYRGGDVLWLREWSKQCGYSGREIRVAVTYLLAGQWPGVADGYVVMSIEPLARPADPPAGQRLPGPAILREAADVLEQSEQALAAVRELPAKWRDAAVWEHDDMGNVQSAQTFDQCAADLDAALGAPPKEGTPRV